MLCIAKHGGTNGVPENIQQGAIDAIQSGFCAHLNMWVVAGRTVTGWKEPEQVLDITKIPNTHIIVCCMNPMAFEFCLKHGVHCYYHTNEEFSLTSKGIPLSFGGAALEGSIIMNPENCIGPFENVAGICSPYILGYIT